VKICVGFVCRWIEELLRGQGLLWIGYVDLVSSSATATTSPAAGFMVTSKIQSNLLLLGWRDHFFDFYRLRWICSSPPSFNLRREALITLPIDGKDAAGDGGKCIAGEVGISRRT
jgi:hypothetical protein